MLQRLINKITKVISLRSLGVKERELISRIRLEKLTYLSDKKLVSIINTCKSIEKANLPGLFIEAGCALGGSTILISSVKNDSRIFNIYDVFGTIPPPTEEDPQDAHDRYQIIADGKSTGIAGEQYYGYQEDLYHVVQSNLKDFGVDREKHHVSLIKGLVQDTMDIDQPVAFAHIDVDWYDPVMTCLSRIFPSLVVGGSIILDDYHDWGGCKKAVDEYLLSVEGQYLLDDEAGSMKISKVAK